MKVGTAVIAGCDTVSALDPTKQVLDLVALAVEVFVVVVWTLRFLRGGMHAAVPCAMSAVRNQSLPCPLSASSCLARGRVENSKAAPLCGRPSDLRSGAT